MDSQDGLIAEKGSLDDIKTPRHCENCHRKTNMRWNCTNCKKILCYNCKFVHSKNKSTKAHTVVEVKTFSKSSSDLTTKRPTAKKLSPGPSNRSPSVGSSLSVSRIRETCKEHEEFLIFHCNTCSKPICSDCILGTHKTHELIKLEHYIKSEKHRLVQEVSEVKKTHILELKALLQNCMSKRKSSEMGLNYAYDELNEHVEKLIVDVRSEADRIADDFKSIHTKNESELSKTEKEINEALNVVNEAISLCENNVDASVYQLYQAKERMTHLNEGMVLPKEPNIYPIEFEKGQINRSLLSKMICTSIVKDEDEKDEAIEEPIRPKSNQIKIPNDEMDRYNLCKVGISCLSIGSDQSITVRDPRTAKGILKICIKQGRKLDVKEPIEFDKYVTDICCYDNKSTLVTFVNTGAIKIVNHHGKMATFTDLSPLYPVSLWKTSNGSILVSVVEGDELEATEDSTRAVYILSFSGRVLKKVEYFQGKRTLNRPYRAVENSKGDIVVIDFIDLDDRVVWMKKDGEEICSYRGHVSPKYPRLMAAQGLACDKDSNVYVSDARNNVIHVVDTSGKFIRFIENDMERFFSPWSLCVDDNKLWIGTSNGRLYRTFIKTK
ncbi:uncharacterized protein LOC133181713 [Saccostrea echinata]|uniref:uncharacterized protein LOC133181713 n=1 Tax=Saccostrea echinata TaxID=191078 RepID=UPI002A7FB0B6|nr:uncharacterized protein LOC133181713 [Saccostrea echinata]